MPEPTIVIRRARTADVAAMRRLVELFASERILLAKAPVQYYEDVQEFFVAELDGEIVGCAALHVLWEDLAEIRSVAVDPAAQGHGFGSRLVLRVLEVARELGIQRIFVLTFETAFFERFGFQRDRRARRWRPRSTSSCCRASTRASPSSSSSSASSRTRSATAACCWSCSRHGGVACGRGLSRTGAR